MADGGQFGDHVVDLGEFVVVCAGEFVRQVDLIVRQNIHDEMRALLKGRQMLEVAEADLERGFVHPQAGRKSLAERIDANDRAFRASRWRRGSVARARVHRAHRRGGPRVRIPFPPPARWYGAGGEEMAPSSLQVTDGVP